MQSLKRISKAGFTWKILCDQQDGTVFRVWCSRRFRKEPHEEKSAQFPTIGEAVAWLTQTADEWVR